MVVSNIFYFHPYLGKLPILTNIFQTGWNHQLVNYWTTFKFSLQKVFHHCEVYTLEVSPPLATMRKFSGFLLFGGFFILWKLIFALAPSISNTEWWYPKKRRKRYVWNSPPWWSVLPLDFVSSFLDASPLVKIHACLPGTPNNHL